ncbi:fungal-specific transcription factor domain-containing protein, partial [Aspergillus varians]
MMDNDTTDRSSPPEAPLPARSRSGCQQCRRRRRKCDEQHPCCTACLTRNLPCNWEREKTTRKHSYHRRLHQNKDFAVPEEMAPFTTIIATPTAPMVDTLMVHFSEVSPLWLTIGGRKKRSDCLDIIMPCITRSPLVLNCVLAVAAGDLSKYQPASADMATLSCGFYGQAVAGIRSALNTELVDSASLASDHADEILLAILLLCVHEVVNFTHSDRVLLHINAAALICYNRSFSAAPEPRLRRLLFELFCYIFTLTAFSHGRNLRLSLAPQIFNSPFLQGTQEQGMLIGKSLDLFYFIFRISVIISKTSCGELDPAAILELNAIESELSGWRTSRLENEDLEGADEYITSELYRLACLIHVKKILNPQLPYQSPAIQEFLSEFISNLDRLPSDSPANSVLCWPLVVAGMAAVTARHRRLITTRLRKNHETWRSDILSKSIQLLGEKWKQENCSEGTADIPCLSSLPPVICNEPFVYPIVL